MHTCPVGCNDNPNNVVKSATVPPFVGSMINYSEDLVRFVYEIDMLEDLGFVDSHGDRIFEHGKFILSVGNKNIEFYR